MSRSGYTDDCDNINLWRGTVTRAINGKRGQKFLRDLAAALDSMPTKRLIEGELIDAAGDVCAIGAVCKAKAIDVTAIDICDPGHVGEAVDIAYALAAEIEYVNDEAAYKPETPEERWSRVRAWVAEQIR